MMLEMATTQFIEQLSKADAVPGGGGASALAGALGAALGLMVANLTIGKKKYAEVEGEIIEIQETLISLRDRLVRQVDEDATAFLPLAEAYRLPKETKEQQEVKAKVMEEALYGASVIPLEIMETALEVMELLKLLGEKGSRLAISDIGVGILFAQTAIEGASLNVFINTKLMKDTKCAIIMNEKADRMIQEGKIIKESVYRGVLDYIR